jgi:hypothetical protein
MAIKIASWRPWPGSLLKWLIAGSQMKICIHFLYDLIEINEFKCLGKETKWMPATMRRGWSIISKRRQLLHIEVVGLVMSMHWGVRGF